MKTELTLKEKGWLWDAFKESLACCANTKWIHKVLIKAEEKYLEELNTPGELPESDLIEIELPEMEVEE
jgi:hypothetical protein